MLRLELKLRRRDISKQVEAQIREAVSSGELQPGDALPPVKELAAKYGINHQTILKAYARLKEDGLLESSRGEISKISGVKAVKDILVVFDIASFSTQLSPGYQVYFRKMNECSVVEDLRIKGAEGSCEARFSPFLSTPTSDRDFLDSPLLARLENDKSNIAGILLVGYAASLRMQSYLMKKNIPYVGIGSTGQYPCQTALPFLELISSGVNFAAKNSFENIAFTYPRPCGADCFAPCFEASAKTAGLKTKKEWVSPVDFSESLSVMRILKVLQDAAAVNRKMFILSADDAATMEILKMGDSLGLVLGVDFEVFSFWTKGSIFESAYKFPKLLVDAGSLFDNAVQLLLDLISGEKSPPCTITVSTELQL